MDNYVAVTLWKGDRVLMQLRDNDPDIYEPNKWNLIGGKCQKGEGLLEAATREFKEETGYILNNPKLVRTLHMPYDKGDYDWHIFFEKFDGKQTISCFEGQEMKFFSIRELEGKEIARKNLEVVKFAKSLLRPS